MKKKDTEFLEDAQEDLKECRHEPPYLTIKGYCGTEGVALIQCDKCESMGTVPFKQTYDYGGWKELRSF